MKALRKVGQLWQRKFCLNIVMVIKNGCEDAMLQKLRKCLHNSAIASSHLSLDSGHPCQSLFLSKHCLQLLPTDTIKVIGERNILEETLGDPMNIWSRGTSWLYVFPIGEDDFSMNTLKVLYSRGRRCHFLPVTAYLGIGIPPRHYLERRQPNRQSSFKKEAPSLTHSIAQSLCKRLNVLIGFSLNARKFCIMPLV